MQFYDITISIFGLSERDGLILDQCVPWRKLLRYFSENVLNKGVKFYNLYEGSWKFDDKKDRKKVRVFAIAIEWSPITLITACQLLNISKENKTKYGPKMRVKANLQQK